MKCIVVLSCYKYGGLNICYTAQVLDNQTVNNKRPFFIHLSTARLSSFTFNYCMQYLIGGVGRNHWIWVCDVMSIDYHSIIETFYIFCNKKTSPKCMYEISAKIFKKHLYQKKKKMFCLHGRYSFWNSHPKLGHDIAVFPLLMTLCQRTSCYQLI